MKQKMIGGLGPCGRAMCCSTYLGDFVPVSIKMAKEQNLSLNPTKISGICGRLMCCLNFEQETYEEIRKKLPKVGSIINSEYGEGEVVENSVVKEMVKVKIKLPSGDDVIEEISMHDLTLISGGYEDTLTEDDIEIEVNDDEDKDIIKELFKDN
ncbi:tpl protein [Clostridium tetani 12124569]|nr:tpl protein [Clostridium tetani 12124569]